MNWIATAFEKLKASYEAHKSATEEELSSLGGRVKDTETYVTSAVLSAEKRLSTLEQTTVQGFENRIKALELKLSSP